MSHDAMRRCSRLRRGMVRLVQLLPDLYDFFAASTVCNQRETCSGTGRNHLEHMLLFWNSAEGIAGREDNNQLKKALFKVLLQKEIHTFAFTPHHSHPDLKISLLFTEAKVRTPPNSTPLADTSMKRLQANLPSHCPPS